MVEIKFLPITLTPYNIQNAFERKRGLLKTISKNRENAGYQQYLLFLSMFLLLFNQKKPPR